MKPCLKQPRCVSIFDHLRSHLEVWNQGDMTCEIFSEIAASEAKTRLFATNIIKFCEKWGFDGFDLDWAAWADGLLCCWGEIFV